MKVLRTYLMLFWLCSKEQILEKWLWKSKNNTKISSFTRRLTHNILYHYGPQLFAYSIIKSSDCKSSELGMRILVINAKERRFWNHLKNSYLLSKMEVRCMHHIMLVILCNLWHDCRIFGGGSMDYSRSLYEVRLELKAV